MFPFPVHLRSPGGPVCEAAATGVSTRRVGQVRVTLKVSVAPSSCRRLTDLLCSRPGCSFYKEQKTYDALSRNAERVEARSQARQAVTAQYQQAQHQAMEQVGALMDRGTMAALRPVLHP